MYPHKDRNTNFWRSVIYDSPSLETIKCLSTVIWISKMWYVHTMECLLFSDKKGKILVHTQSWVTKTRKVKEARHKRSYVDFICLKFLEIQIYKGRKPISGFLGQQSTTFWHQGPVSWKAVFPQMGNRGIVSGWLKCTMFKFTSCCVAWFLRGPDQYWSTAQRLGPPALGLGVPTGIKWKH